VLQLGKCTIIEIQIVWVTFMRRKRWRKIALLIIGTGEALSDKIGQIIPQESWFMPMLPPFQ
jgi:hypothetical protein